MSRSASLDIGGLLHETGHDLIAIFREGSAFRLKRLAAVF
jgi:hypothetical protein